MPDPRITSKPTTALGERWFIEGFALGFSTEDDAMNAWLYGNYRAVDGGLDALDKFERSMKEKTDDEANR